MSPLLRRLSVLLLGTLLLACSDDLTIEDHISNAQALLENPEEKFSLVRLADQRAAIAELKEALKKEGNNVEVNLYLGEIFFATGDWGDADDKLSTALALGADATVIVPMLAQILLKTEQFERLDALSLGDLDPENRSIVQAAKALSMIYREKPELAAETMAAAMQNKPLSPFAEVAAARLEMETLGYEEAGKRLKEIIKRFPKYVPAWNLLGDIESAQGRPAEALAAYHAVITFSGERFEALLNGALMEMYSGRFNRVTEDLKALDEAFPAARQHNGRRFAMALVYLQKIPSRGARKTFLDVLESTNMYPLSLYYLAAIDLEEGFPEFALSHVNQFLGLVPDSIAGMRLAARLELGRGEYGKAEKLLRRVLARHPDDLEALNVLARVQLGRDRTQQAIQTLARLVELQPESRTAKARLGAAYLGMESDEFGIEMLQDVLSAEPGNVEGSEHPGIADEDQRKVEELILPDRAKRAHELDALNLRAQSGQGKPRERTKLVELQSDSSEALTRLVAGFSGVNSEELGLKILRDILSEDPGYEPADILIVLNDLRRRRISDAIKSAQAYRERNPSSATAYGLLGRAYLANGEAEKAEAAFGKVLELRPGDPDAGSGLAQLKLLEEDYDSARNYYTQVLKYYPDHIATRMKIAASFAEEGREQEMLDSLQSAVLANPRAIEPRLAKARYYMAKGQLEDAARLFDNFTQELKEHPDALATVAAWELAEGQYDQALITLRMLTRSRPDISQYHYMKAKAYAGLGDKKRLISELQRAAKLEPDHFYAKVATARLEVLSGQNEMFEKYLADLQAAAPGNLDVMKLEVISAQRKGDNVTAKRLLDSIMQQQPTTANVIALAAHDQLFGNFDSAIILLQNWIKDHPGDVPVREKLAELYGRSNRGEAAVAEYRKILQDEPKHSTALNNLAWHLLDFDPKGALDYAERAILLSPGSSSILDTLAMAQLKNNEIVAARRSIDRARKIALATPELRFHEAQIMAAEGDANGAITSLQALLAEREEFSERAEAEAFLKKLK